MSAINLSSKRKKYFYRKEYYHGKKKIRIVFWPIMLCAFLYLWIFIDTRNTILEDPITVLFIVSASIYFTFHPFFWFLIKKQQFVKDDIYDLVIAEGSLSMLDNEGNSSTIQFNSLKEIAERSEYFCLRFPNYSSIYLPKEQLNQSEIEELRRYGN
ncbi:YcxB family protein [Marivirga lumbricoides]